jgi:hydrogenase/urease accessory protein HupE
MTGNESGAIRALIDRIRRLSGEGQGSAAYYEAASLAQSVLHDTVGGSHPLIAALDHALKSADWLRAVAATRGVVALYDEGSLQKTKVPDTFVTITH